MENSQKKSSQSRSRYQKDYTKLEAIFDAAVERSRKKKIIYYASDRLYSEDSRREMAKRSYKAVAWAEPLDEKDVHTEIIDLAKETRLEQVAPSSTEDKDQILSTSETEGSEVEVKLKPESALSLYQKLKEQAKEQESSKEELLATTPEPEVEEKEEEVQVDTNPGNDTLEISMESPNSDELGFLERYYKTKQEVLGQLEKQDHEPVDKLELEPQTEDQDEDIPEDDPELLSSLIDLITEPEETQEQSSDSFTIPGFEPQSDQSEEPLDSEEVFTLPVFEKEQEEPEETEETVSTESFIWSVPEETQEPEEETTSTEIFSLPVFDDQTEEISEEAEEETAISFDTEITETESNGEAIPLSSLFEKKTESQESPETEEDLSTSTEEENESMISMEDSEAESEETSEPTDSEPETVETEIFVQDTLPESNENESLEDTKPINLNAVTQPEPVEEPVKEVISIQPKSEPELSVKEETSSGQLVPDLIVTGPATYENILKDVNVSRISLACVVAFFALFVILAYPDFLGFDYIGLVLTLVGIFIAWDMGSRNLIFMCAIMLVTLIVCMMVWVYQTRIQVPMLHYLWFFLIPLCMGISYSYINSKRLFDKFVQGEETTVTTTESTTSSVNPEKINLKTIINDLDENQEPTENTVELETVKELVTEFTNTALLESEEDQDHSDDTKEFIPVNLNLDDAPKWEYETVIDDKPLDYDAPIEEYLEEESKEKEAPEEKKIEIPSLSDFISVDQFGLSEEELEESVKTQDTGSVVFGEIPEVSDPDDSDFSF